MVALLWAQGLGVWHHTVHAPALAAWGAVASAGPASDRSDQATAASYRSPWHHTANSADCRLLDQLLLADGVATPALAPAVLPAAPVLLAAARVAPPALAAARPYQARAPPTGG